MFVTFLYLLYSHWNLIFFDYILIYESVMSAIHVYMYISMYLYIPWYELYKQLLIWLIQIAIGKGESKLEWWFWANRRYVNVACFSYWILTFITSVRLSKSFLKKCLVWRKQKPFEISPLSNSRYGVESPLREFVWCVAVEI